MECRAIILDFDGVIVESNDIKHEAFSIIFRRYPEYYDAMISFHRAHNHLPRQGKFRYLLGQLMKKIDYEDEVARLTKEFEVLTRERIISCAYVKGAKEFLDYFYGRVPLYVSSATPEAELKVILKKRDLLKKFKMVFGPPRTKSQSLKIVIQQELVAAGQIIFIGDSFEDYTVAQEVGVGFIGKKSKETLFKADIPVYENLSEMQDFILQQK